MIIKKKEEHPYVAFDSIKTGAAFYFENELFIKVNYHFNDLEDWNAANLNTGGMRNFGNHTQVQLANVEIVEL